MNCCTGIVKQVQVDAYVNVEWLPPQQLLFFMTLLSSRTPCSCWWAESWRPLLCDGFKAGCCPPLGTSSLFGVNLPRRPNRCTVKQHRCGNSQRANMLLHVPDVWDSVCALWTAADFTGAPTFALSLPHLPFLVSHSPPRAPAGSTPVQVFPDWSLRKRTLWVSVAITEGCGSVVGQGGCGRGVRGHGTGARAHRLGDNL